MEEQRTMRAVLFRQHGPPAVLELVQDFPVPKPAKGEVLIRAACAACNPIDWKVRHGGHIPAWAVHKPKIPGADVSGVVEQLGPGCTGKFKVGDRVFGCADTYMHIMKSPYGTYAEFATCPERKLARIPDKLSFAEAASLPLASLTAWQALETSMPLAGRRVLVHAGAGGVGSLAIQISKAAGAHVTTTCSAINIDFVTKQLGADVAVDYVHQRFEDFGPYDVVVDLVGGAYEMRSRKCLNRNGHYSHVISSGWMERAPGSKLLALAISLGHIAAGKLYGWTHMGPSYSAVFMQSNADRGLDQVAALVTEGKLKPIIDRVLPLDKAADAHAYLETMHARGKVVLRVADL